MSRSAVVALCILLLAPNAFATKYPPGPGGSCPDSLTIVDLRNPAAPCRPAIGDSVYGVGGICTAFDTRTSGVGFYMQVSGGGPYSGIQCFTANEIPPYARGDSVVVETAQYASYAGDPELTSLSGSWGHMVVRFVSSGHALPPFHVGTVHEFRNSLANHDADPWAGCLVRVTGTTMRVARTTFSPPSANWMVVDDILCPPGSAGPCDSMYVDGTTLPNPSYGQPSLGTLVNTIEGVYGLHNVYGPRIRLRGGEDIPPPMPPNVADAYPVHADTIRVVFDRPVTSASAQNAANYQLASGGTILSATPEANGSCVDVAIANGLGPGDSESISVGNIVSAAYLLAMTSPQTLGFYNGVISIPTLRAPDPDSLLDTPCVDRSRFSGAGSAMGKRLTFRGICVGALPGSLSYFVDGSREQRSAVQGFGIPATFGHQYLVACGLQEYYGQTEAVYPAYIRDEGAVPVPGPILQTVRVLRDATCDAAQTLVNGTDYCSALIRLDALQVASAPEAPGGSFRVINAGTAGDTILITNSPLSPIWTFEPDSGDFLCGIVGLLNRDAGAYVVTPRSNADFLICVGVTPPAPARVSLSVFPNPARSATVSFVLPRRDDVDLSVFDLGGRKVGALARGSFPAGTHTREWRGEGVPAGVYFVRLRVGAQTYSLRTVRLR